MVFVVFFVKVFGGGWDGNVVSGLVLFDVVLVVL